VSELRCSICGRVADSDDDLYRLAVPEGLTLAEIRERRAQGAKVEDFRGEGITIEIICVRCREEEPSSAA
jgi:hypothetical protein